MYVAVASVHPLFVPLHFGKSFWHYFPHSLCVRFFFLLVNSFRTFLGIHLNSTVVCFRLFFSKLLSRCCCWCLCRRSHVFASCIAHFCVYNTNTGRWRYGAKWVWMRQRQLWRRSLSSPEPKWNVKISPRGTTKQRRKRRRRRTRRRKKWKNRNGKLCSSKYGTRYSAGIKRCIRYEAASERECEKNLRGVCSGNGGAICDMCMCATISTKWIRATYFRATKLIKCFSHNSQKCASLISLLCSILTFFAISSIFCWCRCALMLMPHCTVHKKRCNNSLLL